MDHTAYKSWSADDVHKSSSTLAAAARRVSTGTMTQTAFNELSMMIGFNHNPHGILTDLRMLRMANPVVTTRYDWVHCMLQQGVFTIEVEALLNASASAGVTRAELQRFLADSTWEYPHRSKTSSRQLHRVFQECRVSDEKPSAVKASCSELLGLYGILRFFFGVRLGERPEFARELRSFNAACTVLDLLLAAKSRTANIGDASAALQRAAQDHLQLHTVAYGQVHVKPKHHWLQDVPAQIAADDLVLDAFVVERVHLRIKAVAEQVDNTTAFERSVLSSALSSHLQALEGWHSGDSLLGRTAVLDALAGVLVADRMSVFGVHFSEGDVVLRGDTVGVLAGCLRQSAELYGLVRQFRKVNDLTGHAASYEILDGLTVWAANELQLALAWRRRPDGSVLVVRR